MSEQSVNNEIRPRPLSEFRQAIESGASIIINADNTWDTRSAVVQAVRNFFSITIFGWEFFNFKKHDDLAAANYVSSAFLKGRLGQEAHRSFESGELGLTVAAIRTRLRTYLDEEKARVKPLKRARQEILSSSEPRSVKLQTKRIVEAEKESPARQSLIKIRKIVNASKYRPMRQSAIGADRDEASIRRDQEWLKFEVALWKTGQFPAMTPGISESDIKKIDALSKYADTMKLVRSSFSYRDKLFGFIFKNTSDLFLDAPHLAIQLPKIQELISNGFLDKKDRRLNNGGIRFSEIVDGESVKKDVDILIEGRRVSVLDPSRQVTFADGTAFTVADIFKSFAKKNEAMGDLEYLKDGIFHIQPQNIQVDLTQQNWWEALPEFERLSKDALEARYNLKLADGQGLIIVKASRLHPTTAEHPNHRADQNHAWFAVVVPRRDGTYTLLPFGKYAEKYPPNDLMGQFAYIFSTQKGKICYPDENEGMLHREKAEVPLVVDADRIDRALDAIRQSLQKSHTGNLIFQAQGDNCAAWVQDILDTVFNDTTVPRPFELPILQTEAPFPVNYIVSFFKTVSDYTCGPVANIVRIAVCTLFGAWQGHTVNSSEGPETERLLSNENWLAGRLTLPANLFTTGADLRRALNPAAAPPVNIMV